MPAVDLDSLGDLLVLAFVAVGALLVGLTAVERWLAAETAAPPSDADHSPGDEPDTMAGPADPAANRDVDGDSTPG